VSKYLKRRHKPPSQTWRTFLDNHVKSMVSVDFFTVPTIRFQILYVFLILVHDRLRILHLALPLVRPRNGPLSNSERPFPGRRRALSTARRRSDLRGRFREAGERDGHQTGALGAPVAWQRAYVERVIGTIRRECLDHVIVFSEADLSRRLRKFADYYQRSRTHLSLQKDTPESRPVQAPEAGRIVAIPEVGGLHHRYERRAA
jgi:putative transposase